MTLSREKKKMQPNAFIVIFRRFNDGLRQRNMILESYPFKAILNKNKDYVDKIRGNNEENTYSFYFCDQFINKF